MVLGVSAHSRPDASRPSWQAISNPVSASYGFEEGTGDVQLRLAESASQEIDPNTITLMVTEDPDQKTVTVHLVDAESGVELKALKGVEVAIAI